LGGKLMKLKRILKNVVALKNLKGHKIAYQNGSHAGNLKMRGGLSVKISYDSLTKSLVKKIWSRSNLSIVKGFINFESGKMHLGEVKEHKDLAKQKGLLKNERTLKEGWYSFVMDCNYLEMGVLLVSPFSDMFGLIPSQYSSIFESHIRGLFSDKIEEISFIKMYYTDKASQTYTPDKINSPGRN
jgi:hypothetical protein